MTNLSIAVVSNESIISAALDNTLTTLGYRITGRWSTGDEALHKLSKSVPDLVLLDVELAGKLDGIETAAAIRRFSTVPLIFLTAGTNNGAYSRVREVRPSAMLTKPVRDQDLIYAIDLALAGPGSTPPPEPLFPDGESAVLLHDRLFLKVKDRLSRIMLHEVLWVEADDYYCKVVTDEREYLVTKTLKKFSALLPPDAPFVRCHRSYLVNLQRITEIGEVFLFVGSHKVPVSRSKRAEVLARVAGL